MVDQYAAWRNALATNTPVPYEMGNPASGFYRVRARNKDRSIRFDAVAIWRDQDGVQCARTGPFPAPTHLDEIEELFVNCNSSPISDALYYQIAEGGSWPDDVAPVEVAADLPADKAVAAELATQQAAAKEWYATLLDADGKSRKPATQSEADKAANFADSFQKLEKKAVDNHKSEKDHVLKLGREIDAKWFPTRDSAIMAKKWARGLSDDFIKTEQARRDEEARIANEKARLEYEENKRNADEQARRDAELAAKGVKVPECAPPVSVPIEPPKAIVAETVRVGTTGRRQSLRKVDDYGIEDAGALLMFLASRNVKSANLLAAALADGKALKKDGVEVPGIKLIVNEEVR